MNAQERSFHDAQVRAARHHAASLSRSLTLAIEFEHDMTRLASHVTLLADAIEALAALTKDDPKPQRLISPAAAPGLVASPGESRVDGLPHAPDRQSDEYGR